MRIGVSHHGARFIGLSIEMTRDDIAHLIQQLQVLAAQPAQHFHLCTSGGGIDPLVDIELSVNSGETDQNAAVSGFAITPE